MSRPEGRSSAIVGGVLGHASPTQVKSHLMCPRKWWYEKAAHMPRKEGAGAIRGKLAHSRVEHWLKTGEDVRDQLERVGHHLIAPFLPFAPFNGGPLMIEPELSGLSTPGGVRFVMFADAVLPPGHSVPLQVEIGEVLPDVPRAWVIDHKFKKDLDRYAETADQLQSDEQAILYAAWCLSRWPGTQRVWFAHHNHQTQGRRYAMRRWVDLEADSIVDGFARIAAHIDGPMQTDAKKTRDIDVDYNDQACSKFGGCDFKAVCPHSPEKRFAQTILGDFAVSPGVDLNSTANNPTPGVETMSILDQFKNAAQAAAPVVAPQPVAPAPVAAAPVAPPPAGPAPQAVTDIPAASGIPQRLYMVRGSGAVVRFEIATPSAVFAADRSGSPQRLLPTDLLMDVTEDPQARANFGLPSLAPAAPAPVVAPAPATVRPGTIIDMTEAGIAARAAQGAGATVRPPDAPPALAQPEMAPPPAPVAPAPVAAAPAPAPVEAAPAPTGKKRGRPSKAEAAARAAAGGAPAPAASDSGNDQVIVLIGCMGTAGLVTQDLDTWVSGIAAKIAESSQAAEIRFAPNGSALGFGAWRGALAAAVRMSAAELAPGFYTLSRGDLNDAAIEGLTGAVDGMIRGA